MRRCATVMAPASTALGRAEGHPANLPIPGPQTKVHGSHGAVLPEPVRIKPDLWKGSGGLQQS